MRGVSVLFAAMGDKCKKAPTIWIAGAFMVGISCYQNPRLLPRGAGRAAGLVALRVDHIAPASQLTPGIEGRIDESPIGELLFCPVGGAHKAGGGGETVAGWVFS